MTALFYFLLMASGILHGAREYFHKSPVVFERLFRVSAIGFFGSSGWTRKYKDYPHNTRPKNWIISIFPYNDFWHLSHYVIKSLLILGCFVLFQTNDRWFNLQGKYLEGFIIATIITTFWSGFTFWIITVLLRKKANR